MKYFLLLLPFLFVNCASNASGKIEQSSIEVDTDSINYAILPYDSTKWFYKGGKAFELNPGELKQVDSLLNDCMNKYNVLARKSYQELVKTYDSRDIDSNNFVIDLKRYRRQYLPYIDSSGNKIVHVNCFCDYFFQHAKYWKTGYVMVSDGGNCFFNLNVNLSEKKCEDLMVNGDA